MKERPTSTDHNQQKGTPEEQAKMLGANVFELRGKLKMSAQELSDLVQERFGHFIARSTIQNMESGSKKSASLYDSTLLAECLGVPLGYLMYSPYRPGELVRMTPNGELVPAFWAADYVTPAPARGSHDSNAKRNINTATVSAVEKLAYHYSGILNDERECGIIDEEIKLAKATHKTEWLKNLESVKASLLSSQNGLFSNLAPRDREELIELGAVPWGLENHKIPVSYYRGMNKRDFRVWDMAFDPTSFKESSGEPGDEHAPF